MKWIFPFANKRSFLVLEKIKEASGNEENIQRGPLSQSRPLQQPGPLGFPGLVAPDIFCTKTFGGAGWWGTHCSIRLGCPLNPWGSTHDCYIFHHLHFFLENQQDVSGEHTQPARPDPIFTFLDPIVHICRPSHSPPLILESSNSCRLGE